MANEKRLIDANALIDEINQQRRAGKTSFPRRSYVVGDVLTSIYNAPTVDAVEVVRGEWEIIEDEYLDLVEIKCSVCGESYGFEAYEDCIPKKLPLLPQLRRKYERRINYV